MTDSTLRIARIGRRLDALLVAAFVGLLLVPQVDHLMRDDAARDCATENRRPAGKPSVPRTLDDLRTWFSRYQDHWNDTFGARDRMLRGHSLLKLAVFGVSPTREFVLGDEAPWLFNAGNRELENFRGLAPFTEAELEDWRRALEAHRDAAARVGASYAFVIAPEKHEVYPEHLASRYDRVGPTRREQFVAWMRARSNVRVIDVTAALRAQKNADREGDRVYYESGTHWQGRGAFSAAREIERSLAQELPELDGRSAKLLRIDEAPELRAESDLDRLYVGDLWPRGFRRPLRLIDPTAFRAHRVATNPVQYEISRRDGAGPKALVFHDSYGEALQHWCAAAFSFTRMLWTPAFDETHVARDRPDLVLEIFVERVFLTHRPSRAAPHADPALEVAFRSHGRPVFTLDARRHVSSVEPTPSAAVRLVEHESGPRLELTAARAADSFRLPFSTPGANDRWWIAAIEVDAPVATFVELAISRNGVGYLPAHTVSAPLEIGPNRRFLAIDPRGIDDRLTLRFGGAKGSFLLGRFEIREVAPPR